MHLSEGDLRAYLDGELEVQRQEQIQAHLAGCDACHKLAHGLALRADFVTRRLEELDASPAQAPISLRTARARLDRRLAQKEKTPMFKRIFARPYYTAWAAAALVVLLGVAMLFPPVQAIANSFLGLFRIQQIAVVQVNPGNLPQQLGSSSQLEALLAQTVYVEQKGEPQPVSSAAEASQAAGMPVRLPQGLPENAELVVQPGGRMTFQVDLQRVQAILDEIGRGDIRLPDEVDGAEVTVDLQPSVTAMYGACKQDLQAARQAGHDPDDPSLPRLPNCTTFVQMPSPAVSAPPGLDVAALGQAYLQLLGMTSNEAAQFARNVDWTTTLIIPIPRYGTAYQDVHVDGVQGTFIQQELENHSRQYILMWVKEGAVYAITGPGQLEDALEIASSIQ